MEIESEGERVEVMQVGPKPILKLDKDVINKIAAAEVC